MRCEAQLRTTESLSRLSSKRYSYFRLVSLDSGLPVYVASDWGDAMLLIDLYMYKVGYFNGMGPIETTTARIGYKPWCRLLPK